MRPALTAAIVAALVSAATALAAERIFAPGADFVGTDPSRTTVGIRGREYGVGTLKVTNERVDGAANPNAAAVSVMLERTGIEQTNAQGIFLNAPGPGTTGKLLNLRNAGVEQLVLVPDPANPGQSVLRLRGRIELVP